MSPFWYMLQDFTCFKSVPAKMLLQLNLGIIQKNDIQDWADWWEAWWLTKPDAEMNHVWSALNNNTSTCRTAKQDILFTTLCLVHVYYHESQTLYCLSATWEFQGYRYVEQHLFHLNLVIVAAADYLSFCQKWQNPIVKSRIKQYVRKFSTF